MFLAYMICGGPTGNADLCVIPEKPDQFSVPVRVESLCITDVALFRVGPEEVLNVDKDPADGGLLIAPLFPTKLYLTPQLADYPGFAVKRVKIFRSRDGLYKVLYALDKDTNDTWREWFPNREKRGAAARL